MRIMLVENMNFIGFEDCKWSVFPVYGYDTSSNGPIRHILIIVILCRKDVTSCAIHFHVPITLYILNNSFS